MAKKDTVADIKAANGQELNLDNYNQAQLDQLLEVAKKGEAGLTEFSELQASFKPAAAAATAAPKAPAFKKPVKVQVSEKIAAYGGEFTDPVSKLTVGKDPVTVESTPFIEQKIRTDEIVRVD